MCTFCVPHTTINYIILQLNTCHIDGNEQFLYTTQLLNEYTMGGILKNKNELDQQNIVIPESSKEFRNKVLENTKLNALLKSNNINPNILNSQGEIDPKKIEELSQDDKEKLKWNAKNLQDNEIIQKQIIENLEQTIDEPKTPFQAAVQPELNEYYQDDEEVEDLDNFSLGEPELKVDELDKKFNKEIDAEELDQIHSQEDGDDEDQEDEAPTKPKKSFEELRKSHYHHEHPPIHKEVTVEDELEEDDDDEDEQPKPKKSFAELRKEHYHNEHVPK